MLMREPANIRMIIVAASPSADWTAAEEKENEKQEDGS